MTLKIALLLTLAFFAAFMLLMALGYLFTGKALKGSCGGLSCLFCSGSKREQCREKTIEFK